MGRTKGATKYTPKRLREEIEKYFRKISYLDTIKDEEGIAVYNLDGEPIKVLRYAVPPSVADLRRELGISKGTWAAYQKDERMKAITEDAMTRIEAWLAREVSTRDRPQGLIFNLQSNYGWVPRKEVAVDPGPETHKVLNLSMEERLAMLAEASRQAAEDIEGG